MNGQPNTIAVLTGGGDVPGLNPCIKSLTYRACEAGMKVLGIKRGWAGLLNYDREDPDSFHRCFQWLDKQVVRTCLLYTSDAADDDYTV